MEVYQAHDDNTHQIKDIESLIERKVDLLIVALMKPKLLRQVIEKAYECRNSCHPGRPENQF